MSAPAGINLAMEVSAHDRSIEEVQKIFGVDEVGLSDSQVEDNRKKYGPNGKLRNSETKLHTYFVCINVLLFRNTIGLH